MFRDQTKDYILHFVSVAELLKRMINKPAEWVKYTGSDVQIMELGAAKYGVCLMFEHSQKSFVYSLKDISKVDGKVTLSNTVTHYLICQPHPLADMICQQARTGQPVWVKEMRIPNAKTRNFVYVTNSPDWDIPNAEYSFDEFKEEVWLLG